MMFASVLCTVVILIYFLWSIYIYTGFSESSPEKKHASTFISIVVPVCNEEHNITHLLNSLVSQDYPLSDFEVIIVNDHSTDGTSGKVQDFIVGRSNFTLLHAVSEGKKQALKTGIDHAKGELIITVDADCSMNRSWLTAMQEYFIATGAALLAGPVKIADENNWIATLQQAEYMAMQVYGMSSLKRNQPLLCSGANLAFTRAAFKVVEGYSGNEGIASGDDTFLMLKIHERFKSVYPVIDKRAIVTTNPVKNSREYIQQRIRWGSKVKIYKNFYIKLVAALIVAANLLFILSIPLLFSSYTILFGCILLLKIIADGIVLQRGLKFFGTSRKAFFYPLILLFPFIFLVAFIASVKGSYEWKGRYYKS